MGRDDQSNINPTGKGTASVWERIHTQTLSILKLQTPPLPTDKLEALKELAKQPAATTEIKRQIAIQQNKKSVSDITESDDELRKRYFGDNNDKLPAFLENINNLKAPIGVDQSDTAAKLKTIDSTAGADQVLEFSIYQLKQNLKQATTIVKQQETSIKESETDETCEKKGTGDNCKEGCKEVEEGGKKKCVKNPDYRPKQVEGGEKKLIKCSDATTEEECKKVEGKKPEGKNAVCGWIDYVDGRGKLPKHECLDGCFIGGKQFAIIAAAFVALLF
uniref:Variant surface glycoprotein n=1 Tax=Trypanosoma brucei TaxID=5691 RepID=A0A1V0G078_9TRYP|nr:variant surface glycoprotein [Trypanosoma brucei]